MKPQISEVGNSIIFQFLILLSAFFIPLVRRHDNMSSTTIGWYSNMDNDTASLVQNVVILTSMITWLYQNLQDN